MLACLVTAAHVFRRNHLESFWESLMHPTLPSASSRGEPLWQPCGPFWPCAYSGKEFGKEGHGDTITGRCQYGGLFSRYLMGFGRVSFTARRWPSSAARPSSLPTDLSGELVGRSCPGSGTTVCGEHPSSRPFVSSDLDQRDEGPETERRYAESQVSEQIRQRPAHQEEVPDGLPETAASVGPCPIDWHMTRPFSNG